MTASLHSQQDDLYGAQPEGKPWEFTIPPSLGVAYNRASEDHRKTAHNFARDVVDKAVSWVESRAAERKERDNAAMPSS
jgi:hypothetical protein